MAVVQFPGVPGRFEERKRRKGDGGGNGGGSRAAVILDRREHGENASALITARFTRGEQTTLRRWRRDWWVWRESHYRQESEEHFRAAIFQFLRGSTVRNHRTGELEPYRPDSRAVSNVLEAGRSLCLLDDFQEPPAWLDGRSEPAKGKVACANGIIDIASGKLSPHDPAFFTTWALAFPFEPDAAEPSAWLDFLDRVWPDDGEAIRVLQEMFGYLISGDTNQQKAFLIVGPRRSGKGTIGRVLDNILGRENVAGPSLGRLGESFGLQGLIGKPLAKISDARLSGRTDAAAIAESILRITGEDRINISRKFQEEWSGTLPTRLVIMTNELPRFADASGTLASRFITLVMRRSFFGQEDLGLLDRLLAELPGILNWSLAGYHRLVERGYFRSPLSSEEVERELEELGSPVTAFLRDRCHIGAEYQVSTGQLFEAWKKWCADRGRDRTGTESTFGRDLRAVVAGLKMSQPRINGARVRHYEGVGLQDG